MPAALPWHVTAACRTQRPDALAAAAASTGQYESGSAENGDDVISLRFLACSPTMPGVKTEARAAVMRRFGRFVDSAEVLTLYREADGAVFDAATI
ncbi:MULTISPECIES: hypothetical protein [Mycolicibacter]|uniref:Uncharacterized protein n=2 Tax=Mycolicibacter TaxID=1073531 RepID=A0ABU5XMP3_9MYCO|nr:MULTISPECIES: hypothetical protein [unclassified Mycolicibacter]MEB3023469.1 hypothetical protein [Mycolicibacter sp. MYC098]MEB3035110.1 hypothetical protein [Mycolicibacter sp. MYC340]